MQPRPMVETVRGAAVPRVRVPREVEVRWLVMPPTQRVEGARFKLGPTPTPAPAREDGRTEGAGRRWMGPAGGRAKRARMVSAPRPLGADGRGEGYRKPSPQRLLSRRNGGRW